MAANTPIDRKYIGSPIFCINKRSVPQTANASGITITIWMDRARPRIFSGIALKNIALTGFLNAGIMASLFMLPANAE